MPSMEAGVEKLVVYIMSSALVPDFDELPTAQLPHYKLAAGCVGEVGSYIERLMPRP